MSPLLDCERVRHEHKLHLMCNYEFERICVVFLLSVACHDQVVYRRTLSA